MRRADRRRGETMTGGGEVEGVRRAPTRALWPWLLFSAALAAGLALYFVYPPA